VRNFMSVSTEIQISVYMKFDKMSALSFTAAWILRHKDRREIARCSEILIPCKRLRLR